jgi:PhoPQ-activated pathogenicity-related protein
MDALQDCFRREWQEEVKGFIVSGASKRGWTTWLTAASDARVEAIAPMVIDTLNMQEQLPHQVKMFGKVSDSIRDYTDRGLVPVPDEERAKRLWSWVDPFVYREKFTMPKLMVCGTNDPYWSTDALNLYWDGLPARKWISYSPNAGHNLSASGAGGEAKGPERAINAVTAFVRHCITGKTMPALQWQHGENADGSLFLKINADPVPAKVTLWRAESETTDFRAASWSSWEVKSGGAGAEINVERPARGHIAYFADAGYEIDGIQFALCTQLRIAAASSSK